MNKKIIAISIAFTTAAASSGAMANAKTGLVIGGQIGYAKANVALKDVSKADINKGNLLYGGTIGLDFAVMPALTVGGEVGALYSNSISKISTEGGTDKVSNLIVPVLAKVQLAMPLGFDVFVKGGVSYVRPSASKSGSSYSIDWKSDWNYTAAAGVGYQLGPVNIFAQYMHIFGKDDVKIDGTSGTGYSSKIDSITAGLTYTF